MRKTKIKEKRHIKITIQTIAYNTFIPSRYFLQRWVNAALAKHIGARVNIRLVSKKESTELNRIYRHKKGPTNILSFSFEPPPGIFSPFLGDLVICAPLVNQEAQQQAKARLAHWAHLVIHGCLHLTGYDHLHDKDALQMETIEIKLLEDLGYENPYI
jgi:probable rRNA maturation factor